MMKRTLLTLLPVAGLLLTAPPTARADDHDEDDDGERVVVSRLSDDMYEMIQDRFDEKIDIQSVTLDIEGDEVEFDVVLVSDGRRYEVEFEPGERRIDDDNIEMIDRDADPDEDDDYDDDQHR